jgi:DedD protein
MARPVSDEELQLKKRARRRLVGAIVLVTAVAVILPMVLDSEPKSSNQNVDIQIPSPDSGEFKPKAAATADKAAKALAASADASSGKPKSDPIAAIGDPPAPKELVKEPPKAPETAKVAKEPPVAKESAPKEAPAAAPGAYVVQVAALSDASKARQLEKQMAGAGVKTYTEVVNTQAGEVTRVRAGPFSTREAAEKARTQLKKAGLDGKVVPK